MDASSDPKMGGSGPPLKRTRNLVSYKETTGSEDSEDGREENDSDYMSDVKRKTTKQAIKKRCKWDSLLYCGKLAVEEVASSVKPVICDVSWNINKKLHSSLENFDGFLACTGSFGTYLCYNLKSVDATTKDFEKGWKKIVLSTRPGKLCEWAPANGGRFLALGSIADDGRGRVHLFDCANAKDNLHKEEQAFMWCAPTISATSNECWPICAAGALGVFTTAIAYYLNFKCVCHGCCRYYGRAHHCTGIYLLVTSNKAKTVVMITRKSKVATATYPEIIDLPYMKLPHPTEADIFGIFHPMSLIFFVATSYGVISVYTFNEESYTQAVGKHWLRATNWLGGSGFCGIAISNSSDMLVCPRDDGTVSCFQINSSCLKENRFPAIDLVYELNPSHPVCVKSIRRMDYLATVDMNQLITVYHAKESKLLPLCDNKMDVDVNKNCQVQDAMDWRLDGVVALAGEDGFINFWILHSSNQPACKFTVKCRDHMSEKLFYLKKPPQYGLGEEMQKEMQCLVNSTGAKMLSLVDSAGSTITSLEGRMKTMVSLASEGLKKINQGADLTQDEVKTILEAIVESSYGE